jgi:hypothetical protein
MQESKDFNLADYLLLSSPFYNNELWALKRKAFGQNSLTNAYDAALRGDSHGYSKLIPFGIAGAIASQGHKLPGMLPGAKLRSNLAQLIGRTGVSILGPKAKALLAAGLSIPATQAIVSGEMTRRSLQDKSASTAPKDSSDASRANIAASISAMIPPFFGSLYLNHAVPKIFKDIVPPLSPEVIADKDGLFNRFLRSKKIKIVDPNFDATFRKKIDLRPIGEHATRAFASAPAYTDNNDSLISRLIKKLSGSDVGKDKAKGFIIDPDSFYNSDNMRGVKGALRPGILAHEMGHAMGPKIYTKPLTRQLSMLAPLLATGNIIHTKNEEVGRNTALASPLLASPLLASELDASVRGSNLLNRLAKGKLTKLQRLSPFIGLPTYAALALAPGAAHLTKKYMGGYEG